MKIKRKKKHEKNDGTTRQTNLVAVFYYSQTSGSATAINYNYKNYKYKPQLKHIEE